MLSLATLLAAHLSARMRQSRRSCRRVPLRMTHEPNERSANSTRSIPNRRKYLEVRLAGIGCALSPIGTPTNTRAPHICCAQFQFPVFHHSRGLSNQRKPILQEFLRVGKWFGHTFSFLTSPGFTCAFGADRKATNTTENYPTSQPGFLVRDASHGRPWNLKNPIRAQYRVLK